MAILRDDPGGGPGARIVGGLLYVNPHAIPNGFVPVQFTAIGFTAATTEALLTLTPQRSFAAGPAGTSMTVTTGKRLRLTALQLLTRNASTAAQGVECRVRINPSGPAILSSPVVSVIAAGTAMATANVAAFAEDDIEDVDLDANAQIAVSQIGSATAGNSFVLRGYEYIP